MSFLTTGALTTFTANTKAKSAEVNANNSVFVKFFNTTTSDLLVGNVRQKLETTTTGYTFSETDTIRTLVSTSNTTGSYSIVLPAAQSCTGRIITIKNNCATTGSASISDVAGRTIDDTTSISIPDRFGALTVQSDGSNWQSIARALRYQEGSWTPSRSFSGGNGTSANVTQIGRYIRIGNTVHISMHLAFTKGTGSGNFSVSGLPFTAANITDYFTALSIHVDDGFTIPANRFGISCYIQGNTSTLVFRWLSSVGAAASTITDADMDSGTIGLFVGGWYQAAPSP